MQSTEKASLETLQQLQEFIMQCYQPALVTQETLRLKNIEFYNILKDSIPLEFTEADLYEILKQNGFTYHPEGATNFVWLMKEVS